MSLPEPCPDNDFLASHATLLLHNFQRWTGTPLIDPDLPPGEQAQQLFQAPFGVLSHNHQADPVFTYGNRMALSLFEMSWNELTHMPSRFAAEPDLREERQRLLTTVAEQGYFTGYNGIRVSKNGRRFRIEEVTVWNLLDAQEIRVGQAAVFRRWTLLS